MNLGIENKPAVITGGSKGIGLGMARAFAREGAELLICARTERQLQQAAGQLSQYERTVHVEACDVSTAEGFDTVIARSAELGGADIFVSNAGTGSDETVMEASDEKWQGLQRDKQDENPASIRMRTRVWRIAGRA